MKGTFWNGAIRDNVLSTIYAAGVLTALGFIYSYVKSLISEISLKESISIVWNWLCNHKLINVIALVIIFLLFRWISRKRTPIKWSFKGFVGMGGQGHDGLIHWKVKLFQAQGINRSGKPIIQFDGYLEIERTKERIPIKLNNNGQVVDVKEMIVCPNGEELRIVAAFDKDITNHASIEGYDIDVFLARYTPFNLVLFIEGKDFKYTFTRADAKREYEAIVNNEYGGKEVVPEPKGPRFK